MWARGPSLFKQEEEGGGGEKRGEREREER
jgi:hypothetical protein